MVALPQSVIVAYALAVGAVVGSFLNVLIYRLPREISIVFPRSKCPSCEQPISWYDNVPMLSWLLLLGRCRRCRSPISVRYPLVEALAAVAAGLAVYRFGLNLVTVEVVVFVWASIALALIDLEFQILPNVITYPAIVFGVVFSWLGGVASLWDSLAGLLIGGVLPTAVILLYKLVRGQEGMGWGDVKYLAAIGSFAGVYGCLWVLIVASILGAVVGIAMIVAGRGSSKTALPFGTFLAVAVIVWVYLPPAWRLWGAP